jgi:hypothetical protein
LEYAPPPNLIKFHFIQSDARDVIASPMEAFFHFSHTLLDFRLTIIGDLLSGSFSEIGNVDGKTSYSFSDS